MPLFLQLNLAKLPVDLGHRFGTGLLQLFYCPEEDCDGGYEPFSDCQLVQIVAPSREALTPTAAPKVRKFKPKTITGWKKVEADYPRINELEDLGLKFAYDFDRKSIRVECAPLNLASPDLSMDDIEAEKVVEGFDCDGSDKLGGWPCWIQGIEYPDCPKCNKPMGFVFQFTGDHLPFMLGDVGIGHITQCAAHKEIVAFGWACH
jgi:hypothetical protein